MLTVSPAPAVINKESKELWVTVRDENRIAILDVAAAVRESGGVASQAVRSYYETINGPAQVWFSADGSIGFVISQKVSQVEVIEVNAGSGGASRPRRMRVIDIKAQDPFGFTPFLKTSPDGKEVWLSHKLADAVSAWEANGEARHLDLVPLGKLARPNHVEFVENARGKVVYASLARVDDGGPGGVASSRIAIIDRSVPTGARKVAGTFFSHGRDPLTRKLVEEIIASSRLRSPRCARGWASCAGALTSIPAVSPRSTAHAVVMRPASRESHVRDASAAPAAARRSAWNRTPRRRRFTITVFGERKQ